MNEIINKIKFPINNDLLTFNSILKENLKSDVNLINSIVNYLSYSQRVSKMRKTKPTGQKQTLIKV